MTYFTLATIEKKTLSLVYPGCPPFVSFAAERWAVLVESLRIEQVKTKQYYLFASHRYLQHTEMRWTGRIFWAIGQLR